MLRLLAYSFFSLVFGFCLCVSAKTPVKQKKKRKQITVRFKETNEDGKAIVRIKKVLLPYPQRTIRPVLKTFPNSFPLWTSTYYQHQHKADDFNNLKINFIDPAVLSQKPYVYLSSMIVEKKPENIGFVLPASRKILYSKGQKVFIKIFGENKVQVGQLLRVADTKPIYFEKKLIATGLLRVKAELKIIEVVENTTEAFFKEYKAIISQSFFAASSGDSIIYGGLEKFVIKKNLANTKELSRPGLIVGGRAVSSPKLFNLHSLVYLNAGLNESLSIGDRFPVYQNLKARGGGRQWSDQIAGYISIVNIQKHTATAVVSQIFSDISVGDRFGYFGGSSDLNQFDSKELEEDFFDSEANTDVEVNTDVEPIVVPKTEKKLEPDEDIHLELDTELNLEPALEKQSINLNLDNKQSDLEEGELDL